MHSSRLEILTSDEITMIEETSYRILEEVGVSVGSAEVISILKDAGAQVDENHSVVYYPRDLVKKALVTVPKSFTWVARDPKWNITMGRDTEKVYFGSAHWALNVIDLDGCRRLARQQDIANIARLVDGLDGINEANGMVFPSDVPPQAAHTYITWETARNTSKCILTNFYSKYEAKDNILMGEILSGDAKNLRNRPSILGNVCPISPLFLPAEMLEGTLEYFRAGVPLLISPEIESGATGPITLAGVIAQHNAEVLSLLTISQLVNPGVPIVYGTVSTIMEPYQATVIYSAIEQGLINVALTQMARFYNLPNRVIGGVSSSNTEDIQAGLENGIINLINALAGGTYVLGSAGQMENAMTISYGKIVIDHEILGMIHRFIRGIEVTEETLALDVIKQVGPRGQFLEEEHTLTHLKGGEHFITELANRLNYDAWKISGKKNMLDLAREKARKIIKSHIPEPLPKEVDRELERVVKAAELRKQN